MISRILPLYFLISVCSIPVFHSWSGKLLPETVKKTIFLENGELMLSPCDSLQINTSYDNTSSLEDCCWNISLVNTGLANQITGVRIDNLNGAGIGYLSALGGWTPQNVTPVEGTVLPNTSYIQPGTYLNQIKICLSDRTALPQDFEISWLTTTSTGAFQKICSETVFIDCPLSASDSCAFNCVSGSYNLVFNGDFELGDTGFSSGLPSDCSCNSGTYCITQNAKFKCNNSLWDPVLAPIGSGNYLVVDGDFGTVWSQNVSVVNGVNYSFSFDFYPDISGDPSPTLALYVDGNQVLGNILGISQTWATFCTQWTANLTGSVLIEIQQISSAGFDDYGIDNVSFEACCNLTVALPPTMTVCDNVPVQFHPQVAEALGPVTYSWSPTTGLSAANIPDPVATPGANTVYTLTVTDSVGCTATASVAVNFIQCPCNDQVINGDFEQGATGFNTNLALNCTCVGSSYCIDHNARDKCMNSLWKPVLAPDGIGNFMIVDGFSGNGTVWSQTVNVTAGYLYDFCFDYYPDISNSGPPTLAVEIDEGSGFLPIFSTSGNPGAWQKDCFNGWVANTTGPVTLRITQTNTVGFNDYGIDNIQFGTCCSLKVALPDMLIWCVGDSIQIDATILNSSGAATYTWTPSIGLSDPTVEDPMASPGVATIYTLTVMDASGCKANASVQLVPQYSNLVFNGDFEQGNTGFSTSLPYDCVCLDETFCIDGNARDKCMNSYWQSIQAPGGSGNFMIVDGLHTSGGEIWSQTVNVVLGEFYDFCFDYFPNVSGGGTPQLSVQIDEGAGFSTVITTTGISGAWDKICFNNWSPSATGPITLKIVQDNVVSYSDYGIDNIEFGECIPTQVKEVQPPRSLKVSPNPFSGDLTLDLGYTTETELHVFVYDLGGRLAMSRDISSTIPTCTLNLSALSPGVYLLVVKGESGGIWRSKVVKH